MLKILKLKTALDILKMSLKLYYDFMSQPARACYIMLKCSDIPFESHFIDLKKGQHLTEDYRKINYFRKVPAIDDNGFKLSESIAIVRYAIRTYRPDSAFIPSDNHTRAKVDEFLHWYHLNLRLNFGMYFRTMILNPIISGKEPDKKTGENYLKSMKQNLKEINDYFLSDSNKFIGGSPCITIADIFASCEISQIDFMAIELTDLLTKKDWNFPKVLAWYNLVKNGTQPHFDFCHKILPLVKQKLDMAGLSPKL